MRAPVRHPSADAPCPTGERRAPGSRDADLARRRRANPPRRQCSMRYLAGRASGPTALPASIDTQQKRQTDVFRLPFSSPPCVRSVDRSTTRRRPTRRPFEARAAPRYGRPA
ncbi:hypothetical protein BURPS305_0414 [Burkholderia pseudomallei 305]|nr:hypothetical protein BURPS305_0414 [Burkholderia pseudomallei 305]